MLLSLSNGPRLEDGLWLCWTTERKEIISPWWGFFKASWETSCCDWTPYRNKGGKYRYLLSTLAVWEQLERLLVASPRSKPHILNESLWIKTIPGIRCNELWKAQALKTPSDPLRILWFLFGCEWWIVSAEGDLVNRAYRVHCAIPSVF